jgi:hypothetical protein
MSPDERLFEFVRASDGTLVMCDLRFNGDDFGWEVLFKTGDHLIISRSGFVSQADAVAWAYEELRRLEE